jgi:hypothetical protein
MSCLLPARELRTHRTNASAAAIEMPRSHTRAL